MSKKSIIICIIVLIFALLAAGAFLLLTKTDAGYYLKCKISKAPRMSCEVVVTVDGAPYSLNEADVKGLLMNNREENKVSDFEPADSGCSFRCLGGEYGSQPFAITLRYGDGKQVVIPVSPILGNCWEISEVMLTIDADTASETYTYNIVLTVNDGVNTNSGQAAFSSQEEIYVSDI